MAFKFVFAFCGLLAVANAGLISYATNPAVDAVASTHQNVVRSFDGTVSQYSKAVDTPYSSVRKIDTRINNNVYTPTTTIAKSISYAAPVLSKTIYSPAPVIEKTIDIQPAVTKSFTYAAPAPVAHAVYSAPAVTKTFTYAAPAPVATHVVAKPIAYAAPAAAHVVAKPIAYAAPAAAHVVTKPIAYAAPTVHTYAAAPAVAKTVYAAPTLATTNISHGSAATTYTHNAPGVSGYGTSQTVHYSPAEMVSHMSFDGFGTHWGF